MTFRTCPAQGQKGCRDCDRKRTLRDRKGIEFPIRCQDRRYSQLLNSVPLYVERDRVRNADFAVLYFTDETQAECGRVTEMFDSGEKFRDAHTTGLYFREVL
jgi:putative protease